MIKNGKQIELVTDDELSRVRGGGKFWDGVKKAARWVKDHVVIGMKKIGFKGKF
jgi:hypothetical protein